MWANLRTPNPVQSISYVMTINATVSSITNKMQQSDVYYQLLSQHVLGIIMPIFSVLLHMVYCAGFAGCGW